MAFDPHGEMEDKFTIRPVHAGDMKKGSFLYNKFGELAKVKQVKTTKTGKHGHAKSVITMIGMFTQKKTTESFTCHDIVYTCDTIIIDCELVEFDPNGV